MTQLAEDELIAFQLVWLPTSSAISEVSQITHLIYGKRDLLPIYSSSITSGVCICDYPQTCFRNTPSTSWFTGLHLHWWQRKAHCYHHSQVINAHWGLNQPISKELEIVMKAKLDQPLFRTSIRVLISSSNLSHAKKRQRGFVSALICHESRLPISHSSETHCFASPFFNHCFLAWYHQRRITQHIQSFFQRQN